MHDSIVGFSNSSDKVIVVGLEFREETAEVFIDDIWKLPIGDRAEAYCAIQERIVNELRERKIKKVAIKGSVLPAGSTQLAHLYTAELRGVIMAAAAQAQAHPTMITKTTMSKKFGERKTAEYIADPEFWSNNVSGKLKTGSRETAMIVLMAHKA